MVKFSKRKEMFGSHLCVHLFSEGYYRSTYVLLLFAGNCYHGPQMDCNSDLERLVWRDTGNERIIRHYR